MPIIWNTSPAIGFCTQRLPAGNGYTYTLGQKLGEYLREAERRYGTRNMEWTIVGIEFSAEGPMVWFPYTEKLVSVMLGESAASNTEQALFQLAHEVVHLLEPTHVTPTNVFEEGLATLFSHDMSAKDQLGFRSDRPSYLDAEAALKELLVLYPNAIQRIRQTRKPFFNLSDGDILRACPDVPLLLANQLVGKFVR